MKTIEEACQSTFVHKLPEGEDPEQLSPQVVMKFATDIDRWRAIDDDVRNCRFVQIYVAQMIALHASGRVPIGECLMATACQMVQLGMEMARVELPEAGASVPGRRDREGYTGL